MAQIAELLGLWSNQPRAALEVKALAQAYLDALEEKLRETAEMQAALKGLVHACHGGDKPDCAILHLLRKVKAPAGENVRAKPVAPSSHVDLMAWTRNAHAAHRH